MFSFIEIRATFCLFQVISYYLCFFHDAKLAKIHEKPLITFTKCYFAYIFLTIIKAYYSVNIIFFLTKRHDT